jgi:nucleoside-diphosphate kinase
MATERTLSIIKPDAVKKGKIGGCLSLLEGAGLKILAMRQMELSVEQARAFYAVHKARPFYDSLVKFMTSGPVVVSVLEGDNAIAVNRKVMGATDPAKAEAGTIRKLYANDIEQNAVHGSDGPETAKQEIAFFFPECAMVRYDHR